MTRAIVVHLVARETRTLEAWAGVLRGAGYRVASFESCTGFAACGLRARPDCVVAEANLADCNGLELQELVREFDSTISVVFASGEADFRMIVRAMRGGAIDFLEMPLTQHALQDAVARAAQRAVARRTAEAERAGVLERFERLTPREREILVQVLEGRLNKQIASTLDCQEATVKVHRSRLMRKLGVRSLARLVQLVHDAGIAPAREDGVAGPAWLSAAARNPVDQLVPLHRVIEAGVHARARAQRVPEPAI